MSCFDKEVVEKAKQEVKKVTPKVKKVKPERVPDFVPDFSKLREKERV